MKWITVEDTTWPVDAPNDDGDTLQWRLRYAGSVLRGEDRLSAASILAAFAQLTDPDISMSEATSKLRRARKAAAQGLHDPNPD